MMNEILMMADNLSLNKQKPRLEAIKLRKIVSRWFRCHLCSDVFFIDECLSKNNFKSIVISKTYMNDALESSGDENTTLTRGERDRGN